jgi:hypothetical protein
MAGFQKLDKKQLPQVIGLGVASCGLFGYFAVKMIAPTASAAPPPKTAASATAGTAASGSATTSATSSASSAPDANSAPVPDAPPPTLAMRDPFVPQENSDPDPAAPIMPAVANVPTLPNAAPAVSATGTASDVPPANLGPLPSSLAAPNSPGTLASQPAPIAALPPVAPAWTLTGILESGKSQVAILRNGDARAYVQPGEMVDANFRVVDVTRSFVELRHGSQTYTLILGGPKTPPAQPGAADAKPLVSGSPLPQNSSPAGTATAPIIPASTEKQITPSDRDGSLTSP